MTSVAQPTCLDLGFSGGPLSCAADCSADTSRCSVCGNGTVEDGEAYDGRRLGQQACTDLGFFTGQLGCQADCQGLDISECTNCGNATLEPPELWDGEEGILRRADLGFSVDALPGP